MIVIDVGCARYGGDYSIERLIEEFQPSQLWGFDPAWKATMLELPEQNQTAVIVSTEVAWTHDGTIGFVFDGLNSWVSDRKEVEWLPCFDLARFILEVMPPDDELVLKLDCEGSEYDLLGHLLIRGADKRLSLAWVEWHVRGIENAEERRHVLEKELRCPLKEWRW